LVDGAYEFREIDAEGRIGNGLCQQRKHDQARHYESAVAGTVYLGNPRTDGSTEDHEIERGRDDGGRHALQQGAQGTRHFHLVDRPYSAWVHDAFLTSKTKIPSNELACVSRSRNAIPAASRSRRRVATP